MLELFDFDEQLSMSNDADSMVQLALCELFPGFANVYRSTTEEDRSGVDWWIEMPNGNRFGVDVKIRRSDFRCNDPDGDDLALETWSVVDRKIGWSRDASKRCDYVMWYWADTRRICVLPFRQLAAVFIENWQEWVATYRTCRQTTTTPVGSYQSECVFVPRRIVWRKIYEIYGGNCVLDVEALGVSAVTRNEDSTNAK